jgi:hypothetical protein
MTPRQLTRTFGQEFARLLRDLAHIEARTDHWDCHVGDERCPDEESERVMQEVRDEYARLHRPLQPMNLGVPPMAHGRARLSSVRISKMRPPVVAERTSAA